MRLAKELGIPNVDEMLDGISGLQLAEWMAYAEIEPFGEERADLRMAIETAAICNVIFQTWTGKKEAPFKIEDFMPRFEKKEPISKEDAIATIDAVMMALVAATKSNITPNPSPDG